MKIIFILFGWCKIEIIDNFIFLCFYFVKIDMGVWMYVVEGLRLNWDCFVKWLYYGKIVYGFWKVFINWVEVMFFFNLFIYFLDFIIIYV